MLEQSAVETIVGTLGGVVLGWLSAIGSISARLSEFGVSALSFFRALNLQLSTADSLSTVQ